MRSILNERDRAEINSRLQSLSASSSRRWGTMDVANMLNAGEEPQVIADELGVSLDDVRTAARVLLGHAA